MQMTHSCSLLAAIALALTPHAMGMEIAGDIPLATAEIGLIERVLENLIENALEHTPAGGRVTVNLRRDGEGVLIEVSDTGCGIAATDLPRVFDRFYQAGNEHRGKGHSGLGLAIAKRILELHQQSIKVNSLPGNGASFIFSLAVATQTSMD